MVFRRSLLASSAAILILATSCDAFALAPSCLPGRVAVPRCGRSSPMRMTSEPPSDDRRAFLGKIGLGAAAVVGVRKYADGGVYDESPDLTGKQARDPTSQESARAALE
ncbi:hypothetical protein T484DRAFT_1750929 [Baffinella frigidus]|nr:hypothetical protein T484DRAFT_1750929 [Cryptophyta sp. CCMP2293]